MSTAERTEVAIIGGGIAGAAAAWHLAERGVPVVLLEKGAIGAGASGVNFGGVRQQGRDLRELPLSIRARALWDRLPAMVGEDCEFTPSGHLKLAYSDADMAGLERYAIEAGALGLTLELLGAQALRRLAPWVGPEAVGASFCRSDGHANPRPVAPALARAARDRGALIRPFTRATAIEPDPEGFRVQCEPGLALRARVLVNAAGAWAAAIAARFGEPVPLMPIAPHAMVTEPLPPLMDRSIGVCGGAVALRQTAHGSVVIGGGESHVDMVAERAWPSSAVAAAVLGHAIRAVPALRGALVVRAWAGIEGDMADHVPVLGPSRTTPGLIHAFGFSQHGFQLGLGTGEVIADFVTHGATGTDVSGLTIDRFRPIA